MTLPKVSVIVPVYMVEPYVRQCIDSILNQTFSDFELILVNDGSMDNCGEICNEYAERDKRIFVIHQENMGLAGACTTGINKSNGEFLCFVDSDDYVDEDYIERMVIEQEKTNSDIVCCQEIREYVNYIEKAWSLRLPSGTYELSCLYNKLINDGSLGGKVISNNKVCKLFKSNIIKNNLKYYRKDISHGEDQQIVLACLLDCKKVSLLSDFYPYHYRINANSITGKYNPDLWVSFLKLNEHIRYITREKDKYNFLSQLNSELIHFAKLSIVQEYNISISPKNRLEKIKEILETPELMSSFQNHSLVLNGKNKLLVLFMKKRYKRLIKIMFDFKNRIGDTK